MSEEYLATGFAGVDSQEDGSAYARCLALIDSLPYYRKCKETSYRLLDLSSARTVLDVGCGLGDDVVRMAGLVIPGGRVVGVDASSLMVEEAARRAPEGPAVEFRAADARDLPFENASFSRCRIDRTLQHIDAPLLAINEMARILEPGGILLAFDNDWGTFTLNGRDQESTRVMETLWQDSFTVRWVGRYLKGWFLDAGLVNIEVYPSTSIIEDFELADRVYNLRQTAGLAVEKGRATPEAAALWLDDMEAGGRRGRFFCSLTAFMVRGWKPA